MDKFNAIGNSEIHLPIGHTVFLPRQIFSKPEGELFKKGIEYSWSSFRKELIEDNDLMSRYQKAKELCIDLKKFYWF